MSIHRQRAGRPWRSLKSTVGPVRFMATVWGMPTAFAFSFMVGHRCLMVQRHPGRTIVRTA